MACCGPSVALDVASESRRLSRGKSGKTLGSTDKAKSLYSAFPFGDGRSCEIFVEHAAEGFWHCAACGLPKCSHFSPSRSNPPPASARCSGPLLVRKTSREKKTSWRERHGVFVGARLRMYAAEGHPTVVASYVVCGNSHVVEAGPSAAADGNYAFRLELGSGARLQLAAHSAEARDAWTDAFVAAQRWLERVRAWRTRSAREVFDALARRDAAGERLRLRDDRTALDRRLRAVMEDVEALEAAEASARPVGLNVEGGGGGAAGAGERAVARLACRLEVAGDRDLRRAFSTGVAGKASSSLMKLNLAAGKRRLALAEAAGASDAEAAARALVAPVGERLRIAAVDARERSGACTRVLACLLREPTVAAALVAYSQTYALGRTDGVRPPISLLADAALLSYAPPRLGSPASEGGARYATAVLVALKNAAEHSAEGHDAVSSALRCLGAADGDERSAYDADPWAAVEARVSEAARYMALAASSDERGRRTWAAAYGAALAGPRAESDSRYGSNAPERILLQGRSLSGRRGTTGGGLQSGRSLPKPRFLPRRAERDFGRIRGGVPQKPLVGCVHRRTSSRRSRRGPRARRPGRAARASGCGPSSGRAASRARWTVSATRVRARCPAAPTPTAGPRSGASSTRPPRGPGRGGAVCLSPGGTGRRSGRRPCRPSRRRRRRPRRAASRASPRASTSSRSSTSSTASPSTTRTPRRSGARSTRIWRRCCGRRASRRRPRATASRRWSPSWTAASPAARTPPRSRAPRTR